MPLVLDTPFDHHSSGGGTATYNAIMVTRVIEWDFVGKTLIIEVRHGTWDDVEKSFTPGQAQPFTLDFENRLAGMGPPDPPLYPIGTAIPADPRYDDFIDAGVTKAKDSRIYDEMGAHIYAYLQANGYPGEIK